MELDKIKEWIPPKGSYGFSAWETFSGDIFRLRTGDGVSVLNTAKGDFEIKLCGKVEVSSDAECWGIVIKFDKLNIVVTELIKSAYKEGKAEAKKELRDWLRY